MNPIKKRLWSLIGSLVRNRKYLIKKDVFQKDLVDIGCGSLVRKDFISIDYAWHRSLDICWDIRRELPLPNDSVSGVFSQHCLEHLSQEDGLSLIREIHRILRPGGVVRLSVPDGELYMRGYVAMMDGVASSSLPYAERDSFHGNYQPILSVNRIFRSHGHQFIYDYALLSNLLSMVGFGEIEKCEFRQTRDARLAIDCERRAPESLYIEATKPATLSNS